MTLLCRVLEVSRSGYYAWLSRESSASQIRRESLLNQIKEIDTRVKGCYGSPRIHAELVAQGVQCSVNSVAKVMREGGIAAKTKRKYRITTNSNHTLPIADNVLNRDFTASQINEKWVSDITYIRTHEGWLYLGVILDLFSRRVVGWSMSETMTSRLVVDAYEMARRNRLDGIPLHGSSCLELVLHSDRGVQYASEHYQCVLNARGIRVSMSRRGNCWDNAPMESFFASLKKELVHNEKYATFEDARSSIFEYIEVFYNRERRHSTLGYVAPEEYERLNNR